jgi:LPS export ABC transporter permease LptG
MFGIIGLVLLIRLEWPGDHDLLGTAREWIIAVWQRFRSKFFSASTQVRRGGRLMLLPQVIDGYILSSFLYYFLVWLLSFIIMTQVYVFFDLLNDIVKNKIPMARVGTYLFFLTPKLIYDSTPMSVLVATLVTFGVLSKNNEVTAMKACGVSLHRLAVPILLATAGISVGIFAFDHYYVPDANRIQDGLLNEIKGRPVQTFLRPDRKWIFGKGSRIYYYTYFDPAENVMHGVRVYELDPEPFRLKRHISAERARWEPSLQTWVFQNGWTRDFEGIKITGSRNFQGEAMTFAGLDEPPGYFLQEVKQAKQMNFLELEHYMMELRQSGLDITRLAVQFHKKFSVPLFALIMAMIAVPFAFLAGGKGSMASVGVSFIIAIAYFSINQLFEQFGNLNQLPARMAAWSPDVLFGLAGLYLLFRMKT